MKGAACGVLALPIADLPASSKVFAQQSETAPTTVQSSSGKSDAARPEAWYPKADRPKSNQSESNQPNTDQSTVGLTEIGLRLAPATLDAIYRSMPISHLDRTVAAEFLAVTPCLFEVGDSKQTNEPARIPSRSKSLPLNASTKKPKASTSQPLRMDSQAEPTEGQAKTLSTEGTQAQAEPRTTLQLGDAPNSVDSGTADKRQSNAPLNSQQGGRECPGAPKENPPPSELQPGDIPLDQEAHPYDAPAAQSNQGSTHSVPKQARNENQFSRRELAIRDQINDCLAYFLRNPESVVRRGPWALLHATLPFGVETEVIAGRRRVNAIGWMCFNGVCAKQRMFQPTRTGFRTNIGPGVQGHEGQFLAILAQSRVQSSYPIRIGNRRYTVRDLVQYEMATCVEKSELTFKLIGLSYYLDQNQRWKDRRGHLWTLEKMVAEELAQPINGAACGGSHRLMGLSYAVIERQKAGLPISGHFQRAEQYLNDYVNYAMSLQNPDGSFSTEWFESRGRDPNVERKVQTTGHIVEWLVYTLPDEHLKSPRVQKSIEFLLDTVGANPSHDWPIGPRGHALRALALYNQRVFGAQAGQMNSFIANSKPQADALR